jgi:N utilization substance protein B
MIQSHPFLTPRQKAREIAFQFLFRLDQEKITDDAQLFASTVEKDFEKHASHFQVPPESFEFSQRLVRTTATCLQAIDDMIVKHAQNWRIERIGAIEKAFLRMGTAELMYFKDVPASVTLNEVVELSKIFGEAETPLFLNGILDPISKEESALKGKIASE